MSTAPPRSGSAAALPSFSGGAASTRPRESPGSWLVTITAELMVTAGAVLALFVVWELWLTGIGAERDRTESLQDFYSGFEAPGVSAEQQSDEGPAFETCYTLEDGTEIGCAETMRSTAADEPMGTVYAPRMGEDWAAPVRSGAGPAQLDRGGVGHYTSTQLPDEPGNFAVAGHRNTYGSMLGDQDEFVTGDGVYVVTGDGIYVYEIAERHVVNPWDNNALLPVPWETDPDTEPEASVLTLTTCHPMYSNQQRLVHHAEITDFVPLGGPLPAELDYVEELAELFDEEGA